MAVTAQTRDTIIGLSVAMLGKAPGTALLNEWYGVYNASVGKGMSPEDALLELANHIAASSAFTSMYPFFITNAEFATEFLTAALGEAPSEAVLNLAEGLLNDGMGRGEMGLLAVRQLFEIRMQGESHPAYGDFGALAMMFANKVEVATYYTVTKRWEGDSASVLGGVTGDGDSVTAAKEAIDMMQRPGKSFELTTGVDRLDGTLGDDTFVATEKTLTGVDRIDGGEGMDTLELSSSGSDDDVNISSGTRVMNVETLAVDSGGDFKADLSGWTGLATVELDVEGAVELDAGGVAVVSESLGNDDKDTTVEIMNAASVDLEDVSEKTTVKITGEGTESVMVEGGYVVDVNSAAAPSETLKSVTLDGVHDGMGADGKRYQLEEGSTVNGKTVTKDESDASKDRDPVPVHIYSKVIESVDLRNTNTTLLVENAAKDMTELTAMVDKFGNTANGHGKLCLKGIEDLMIEVKGDSNIRLASDEIKTVAVSGAGDLTLSATKFKPAVAENEDAVKPSETLEKLTLSGSGKTTLDAKGLKKLKTVDASEASGDVKLSNLGASVESYMGSEGKDEVSVEKFHKDGLKADLGDGDDTFTVTNVNAGKSKIDGGDGADTLVLKETKGANLKGAGSAYVNFENITLDASEGSGEYDVKGLGIDKLKVGKGTTSKVTFKNVVSGTPLEISSSAPGTNNKTTATAAVVSYMLEDGDDDSLNLTLHTTGGKEDVKADFNLASPKMHLTLTLDEDIEELTVHSTAKAGASTIKSTDYINVLSVTGAASAVEELTVTGDAALQVARNAANLLNSLEYVDARGNTGGLYLVEYAGSAALGNTLVDIEIHGSPADDILSGNSGKKSTIMGNGGDDVIISFSGPSKITGGAGGDWILTGGVSLTSRSSVGVVGIEYGSGQEGFDDKKEDVIIYNAASDSQINFSEMTGFDLIFDFEVSDTGRERDKIDLSDIVDLTGNLLDLNTEKSKVSTQDLKTAVGDGKNFFMSKATTTTFATASSVVYVNTTEDKTKIKHAGGNIGINDNVSFIPGDNTKIQLTWVLVDVDGDGDFSEGTDMAIALAGHLDLVGDNFM